MYRFRLLPILSMLLVGALIASCQSEETPVPTIEEAGALALRSESAIPYGEIKVENNMLAFPTAELFGTTLQELNALEAVQPGGEGETHPELATFEAQFDGFESQRQAIQHALFNTEYDLENIPGSDAVRSQSMLAMLNSKGQVQVAGEVYTFSATGVVDTNGKPLTEARGEDNCCFRWLTAQEILPHSGNQYLVGESFVYSWNFPGGYNVYEKGTTTSNFIYSPFLNPFPTEWIQADPIAAFYKTGSCSAEADWFRIYAASAFNTWTISQSGFTNNFTGQFIYNSQSDIHFAIIKQYGIQHSIMLNSCN